jgi:O-antigen ligase
MGMLMVPAVRGRMLSAVRPHGERDSNQHRIVCLRIGMQMIQAHPLLGVGPEMVKAHYMDYLPADIRPPLPEGWYGHLHNIYVHYAAERGIPTAVILTAMLVVMFLDFHRAARRLPPGRSDAGFVLRGAAACVIAVAVSGFFEHNLGDSEVLSMFLAVAAGGYLGVEQSATAAGG